MTHPTLTLLHDVLQRYSRPAVAQQLGVDPVTVGRWINGESKPKAYVDAALRQMLAQTPYAGGGDEFRFIDLFAGIGGLRQAFEGAGGQCVFTSEWDATRKKNLPRQLPGWAGRGGRYHASARGRRARARCAVGGFSVPAFLDCRRVKKKNALGRAHGFADATQGTLFF